MSEGRRAFLNMSAGQADSCHEAARHGEFPLFRAPDSV